MEHPSRGAEALYDNAAFRRVEATEAVALGDPFILMERAGAAGCRHLLSRWPQAQRIAVVCGPGNNGGDGYVLARHALESGRSVNVLRTGAPRSELAIRACNEFESAQGRSAIFDGVLPECDVVVDGLFGIGLTRAPDPAARVLIEAINARRCDVLALDVPSGVDADCGHVPGAAIRATETLQFIGAHAGLVTGAAIDHCGALRADGLAVRIDDTDATAFALRPDALEGWLSPRLRDTHKGSNGHVLCIGGDHGSGGAIVLCADAALRSGAGLVSVATRSEHVPALLGARPEAMVQAVENPGEIGRLLERASVVAIGPGLGQRPWGANLLCAALQCDRPLVLDADALNLLALNPHELRADCVITPHPGEAARLLGIDTSDVQRDRFAAALALAERYRCVVVLKGAGTIVAAPARKPRVVIAGNPGMAAGGMGDLLTGVIGALRAQGLDPFDAACCGALLHSAAGDAAARDGGERGLLPSDLLPHLRLLANPESR